VNRNTPISSVAVGCLVLLVTPAVSSAEDATHPSPILTKWSATVYGFVELDSMYDTTQGLGDTIGNAALPPAGTYAATHDQVTFTARNSRIGLSLKAPDVGWLKLSARLEGDFFANQPAGISEAAFFSNPGFRIRHAYVQAQTPYLDVLIGQSWQVFGWLSDFIPATVNFQGLPGQLYGRSAQIRLSKTVSLGPDLGMELAIAALRPPQRAGGLPDGQAGLKLFVPGRKAYRTAGAAVSSLDAMALGISGVVRRFAVPKFEPDSKTDVTATGWGIAVDLLLPIIAASTTQHDNALTFTGSFASGRGISDLYTDLGGPPFPPLPNPQNRTPAPVYSASIDPGLVGFDSSGVLHPVSWQSCIVGLQYWLPGQTGLWIAGTYSHLHSSNVATLSGGSRTSFVRSQNATASLFWDATRYLRFGLEFDWLKQDFIDSGPTVNKRIQFGTYYVF